MCKYTCVQIYKQRRIVSPPGGFAEALPSLANSHSPISVQLCSPSLLLFYTTFGLVTSHYPFFFHFSLLIKYFCFFIFQLPFCFLPFVYIHFALEFPFNQLSMTFVALPNCHPLYHFLHYHALFCQNSSRHVFVIPPLLI